MEAFQKHTGIVATLNRSNVDTDQIIPKQFLKSILRTGYGPSAFFDWRYNADGNPDPDFELNAARFAGRSILVTGNNFGCGSSREHAVWALLQDGFRVVIAPRREIDGVTVPGFADIFRNNAVKNGLLTIELSQQEVDRIISMADANQGLQATVSLDHQTISLSGAPPTEIAFYIDPGSKERLIGGLDDIAISLEFESQISAFEKEHPLFIATRV